MPDCPNSESATRNKKKQWVQRTTPTAWVIEFGNYGWYLQPHQVYHPPLAKCNPIHHFHSRDTRATVATTFRYTPTHSIHRDTNHQNSTFAVREYRETAPQRITTARICPLLFPYSARKCGGYIPLPPPLHNALRSEIRAKETHSVRGTSTALAKLHHSTIGLGKSHTHHLQCYSPTHPQIQQPVG